MQAHCDGFEFRRPNDATAVLTKRARHKVIGMTNRGFSFEIFIVINLRSRHFTCAEEAAHIDLSVGERTKNGQVN